MTIKKLILIAIKADFGTTFDIPDLNLLLLCLHRAEGINKMKFKFWVSNTFLCIVILVLAVENLETWTRFFDSPSIASTAPEKSIVKKEISAIPASIEEPSSIQSYNVISEKNIFSPERRDFPAPAAIAGASKPPGRPQVILSGVIIFDDYQAASVSSPGRPLKKGERETMTLKLGGKIGEYKLARIAEDRITLEAGGDSFEVLLYDPKKTKARVEVRAAEVKASESRSIQPAPAALPAVEAAKAESMEKPGEPAKERVITHAPPLTNKDILISRFMNSAANRLRQSFLRNSNKSNTGIDGSTTGNRDESSGSGKTGPR